MKSYSRIGRKYGWRPSLPDHRALKYACHAQIFEALPAKIDLRDHCPPVYDQGDLGSCTANAAAGLAEFLMLKENKKPFTPSRLFIYYNERVIEGTVNEDSGASLSDAIQVLTKEGAPHESLWWYDVKKFAVEPNHAVYADGRHHRITGALSLNNTNLNELKSCLVSGYPFIFGVVVYNSFESNAVAQSGMVPVPGKLEQQLGGHALMCVGYDDSKQAFIVRNSWGNGWGLKGYCMIPYAYMTDLDLADDFWTAHVIS